MSTILYDFSENKLTDWQNQCSLNVCLCLVWELGAVLHVPPPFFLSPLLFLVYVTESGQILRYKNTTAWRVTHILKQMRHYIQ